MPIERITELPKLPERAIDAHKGSFGRVLVVGGSRGMSGAIALAGTAALRGGAGLVYLAVPQSIEAVVASIEPSYLVVPLSDDESGQIAGNAAEDIASRTNGMDAIAIGPGLGTSDSICALVFFLFKTATVPLVADADALNALATVPALDVPKNAPRVLTPHPGEFARLTGHSISEIQNNREDLAVEFAARNEVVLLLKGHETVITDGNRLAVNTTGNSGMATGGSGDVLTGLIASLLGQGMEAFEAAQLAAHVHGLAGDVAANEFSQRGMIASDLPRFVGHAWRLLEWD